MILVSTGGEFRCTGGNSDVADPVRAAVAPLGTQRNQARSPISCFYAKHDKPSPIHDPTCVRLVRMSPREAPSHSNIHSPSIWLLRVSCLPLHNISYNGTHGSVTTIASECFHSFVSFHSLLSLRQRRRRRPRAVSARSHRLMM